MPYSEIETVLLAAGLSQRFGTTNKLLIDWDGVPLIRRTASLYCALGMPVTVVLGYEANAVKEALDGLPLKTIVNANYARGQPSSIRAGLAATNLESTGLLIALGDQPLLEKSDISELCAAFLNSDHNKILIPYFENKRGNPTLLPIEIVRRLQVSDALPRAFMDAHPDLTCHYAAPNAHFTTDLDSQRDIDRILGKKGR